MFLFKAKKKDGTMVSGNIKAKDVNEVYYILQSKKLEPIVVNAKKTIFQANNGKVATKAVVQFTRQLSFLINSGIPIVQALQIVKEISTHVVLREVIAGMISSIEKGSTFAQALSGYPIVFSNVFIHMIQAGETGGSLDIMLTRLATDVEEGDKIRSRVKKAMMYPSFVLTMGLGVVAIIMIVVVPKFVDIFNASGAELPSLTRLLIAMSNLLVDNILVGFCLFIVIPFVIIGYLRSATGRRTKDNILLFFPILGKVILQSNVARLSRTLSSLLKGGVNMIEALDTAIHISNNVFIEDAITNVKVKVLKGQSISLAFKQEKIIPSLFSNMVAIGEETGNIDSTLEKVAEFYEEQVKTITESISDLIQPVLVVVLGGIVGFVVLALYLPIMKMPGTMS